MRKNIWRLVASIFVAAMAVALLVAIDKAENACENINKRTIMKIFEANGCIEFWINRYQSLIGSAITAAIAAMALIWAGRQALASKQQAAVAGAATLRVRVTEINREAKDLELLRNSIVGGQSVLIELANAERYERIVEHRSQVRRLYRQFSDALPGLAEHRRANASEPSNLYRDEVAAEVAKIRNSVVQLYFAYFFMGSGDEIPQDRRSQFRDLAKTYTAAMPGVLGAIDRLKAAIDDDSDELWHQIRRFEKVAVDGK